MGNKIDLRDTSEYQNKQSTKDKPITSETVILCHLIAVINRKKLQRQAS